MVISELMSKLESFKAEHGDLVVITMDDGSAFDLGTVKVMKTVKLSEKAWGDWYDDLEWNHSEEEIAEFENVIPAVYLMR